MLGTLGDLTDRASALRIDGVPPSLLANLVGAHGTAGRHVVCLVDHEDVECEPLA